jgi:hypothetical protein
MTEQVHGATPGEPDDEVRGEQPVRTGIDEVDVVLADVEGLGDVPVDQHVETFERAHEALRGALDGRGPAEVATDEPA